MSEICAYFSTVGKAGNSLYNLAIPVCNLMISAADGTLLRHGSKIFKKNDECKAFHRKTRDATREF